MTAVSIAVASETEQRPAGPVHALPIHELTGFGVERVEHVLERRVETRDALRLRG